MATSIAVGIVKVLSNFSATNNPTTANDNTQGYAIGSVWINTTTDTAYRCFDASTGAAVWSAIGAGGGGGLTVVTPVSYPYNVSDGEVVLVDTTAARSISFPPPAADASIIIKDAVGQASTYNITMVRSNVSELMEGVAADYLGQADWGVWHWVSDGTDWYLV